MSVDQFQWVTGITITFVVGVLCGFAFGWWARNCDGETVE